MSGPRARLLRPAWLLPDPERPLVHEGWSVRVEGERIAALGPDAPLSAQAASDGPATEVLDLPGMLLMPGLVNAHQHGRGISQLLLGYPDDLLEPWIAQRLQRGAPDAYALTRLAAASMLRNGVTCAVHANYSYGSGDYEAEARASLDAYLDAGLRVTFCVGAMDQGQLVYPSSLEPALLAALPAATRSFVQARGPGPYAGGAADTVALMRRLQADYGAHPLVTLAYGPAGPQWVSDALLSCLARDAAAHGLGLHMHLLESPVQARMARQCHPGGLLRHLERAGALGPMSTLAHGVHLDAADIEVIARTGTHIVHNPGSNLRLSNGLAPVAQLLAAGVPVAVGTDNCALSDTEDLLGEVRLADLLARRDPRCHRASAASWLARATTTGARAAFVGDRAGRIAPGLCADLMALRLQRVTGPYRDPDMQLLDAVALRAQGADVALTMVAGQPRWLQGAWVGQDIEPVERAAALAAQSARSSPRAGARQAAHHLAQALRDLHELP